MCYPHPSIIRRSVLYFALFLSVTLRCTGQSADLEPFLGALLSVDPGIRGTAFYSLLAPYRKDREIDSAVAFLLRSHPADADQVKVTLIKALELANAYKEEMESKGVQLDEAFSDYWPDLIWAVGSLRNPGAAKGLIGGLGTGGMAANYIADIFPYAVDALIQKLEEPDHQFRGLAFNYRSAALSVLGLCMTRVQVADSHPDAVAKIREALLHQLASPDPSVRSWAASGLAPFRADPIVKEKLETLALSDPGISPIARSGVSPFVVRNAAATVLETSAATGFYVIRTSSAGECRVQRGDALPIGERLIGPFEASGNAQHQMCTHLDESATDGMLCWRTAPANACR